jgi:hypothetical protein
VTRVLAAAAFVFACVLASTSHDAAGFDFDEVMMIAMGFAGLAYVIADLKRERRLDQFAVEIATRLGAIESATGSHAPHTIAERVASIESALETFDPVDMRERLRELEARADIKPWTATRRKDGKFARREEPVASVGEETKP